MRTPIPTPNQTVSKIFSGNANIPLALDISSKLNNTLGNIEVTKFADNEINVEINETVRGVEVYIIQPTCAPVNDNLMELLTIVDAFKRSDVSKIITVIPYYGYSRQDRRPDYVRAPISSKMVATLLESTGVHQIIVVDIHSNQQQGFFNIPFVNISASPEIIGDIWKKHGRHINNLVVVSPDTGGVPRARYIAKRLNDADLAIIDKRRPKANIAEVMNIIGEVKNRECIMVDDMIDTAGTLCAGAKALMDQGAKSVSAYASHAVFSGPACDNIDNSVLSEVVVTDTIPLDIQACAISKIRIISVANLIAETIRRLQMKQSVSELYYS